MTIVQRKLKEEEARLQKAQEMKVAASGLVSHLERAIASSSTPVLVEALSAVDAAVASHPTLFAAYPQVAALRTEAHARVTAFFAADARMSGSDASEAVSSGPALVPDDDEDSELAEFGPSLPPGALSASPNSSASSIKNLASRLVDTDDSVFDDGLSAITGIFGAESLPFAEAAQRCDVKGVRKNVTISVQYAAKMRSHGKGGALTADQIAAIHLYTQACAFYKTLNSCLRNRDRARIKPFFPYLRLLLEGLQQLPAQSRPVCRGVKLDLSAKFRKGDEPVWWSVTSTSSSMDVLQSKEFCGQDGPRTVFVVQTAYARDIAAFSAVASEEELILLPGAQLLVKSVVPMGGGLQLVQMDEVGLPMSLLEFEEN
jgi:hypothetical protein